jgi:hypothetical protein
MHSTLAVKEYLIVVMLAILNEKNEEHSWNAIEVKADHTSC